MRETHTYPTGVKIKEARLSVKITASEMAKRLGLARQTYNYLELGQVDPRFQLLQKIASMTEKPLAFFYDGLATDALETQKLINKSRNQGIVFACRELAELYGRADLAKGLIETIGITIDCGREKDAKILKDLIGK